MRKKTIKVRQSKRTGECYFRLSDFKNLIDIDKVQWYSLEEREDGSLALSFFDKDQKQLLPKEKTTRKL